MDAIKIRNIFLIAVGLFFAINGLRSGNIGSAVIGVLLAAIAFFVAITGKVHRKFYKKNDASAGAMTTSDDQELIESVKRIKNKVEARFNKEEVK